MTKQIVRASKKLERALEYWNNPGLGSRERAEANCKLFSAARALTKRIASAQEAKE